MTAAPNHLAAVFPQLEAMIDSGDRAGAVAMLNTALTRWDPKTAPPHVFLISAARIYVRLLPFGDTITAQQWARYARCAARRLFGPVDRRTGVVIESLCQALSAAISPDPSAHRELVQAWLELIDIKAQVYGLDAAATLRARSGHGDACRGLVAACAAARRERTGPRLAVGVQ